MITAIVMIDAATDSIPEVASDGIAAATDSASSDGTSVSQTTEAPVETVDSRTPILAALATMTQRRMRHLPVVEEGQIRGIVSIGDLVKHRIERIEAEADALRTYIQSA